MFKSILKAHRSDKAQYCTMLENGTVRPMDIVPVAQKRLEHRLHGVIFIVEGERMATIHFKTRGGAVAFIIIMIILYIIDAILRSNAIDETLNMCTKSGITSMSCIDSQKKNGVSCREEGIYIKCRK